MPLNKGNSSLPWLSRTRTTKALGADRCSWMARLEKGWFGFWSMFTGVNFGTSGGETGTAALGEAACVAGQGGWTWDKGELSLFKGGACAAVRGRFGVEAVILLWGAAWLE